MSMMLLTGASGFLGGEIIKTLGAAKIKTLSRHNADYIADLRNEVPILNETFETVIHAAGKAHMIPKTPEEKQDFFNVNLQGTQNLLTALEKSGLPQHFVLISTVAVYGAESGTLINEDSPLRASDPYGQSKIEAENLVTEWVNKHKVTLTILRLPLLAGPNPPGNLKSMINGIKKGYYFNIAGGKAKKSMVLAVDVASIIPITAPIGGTYNLTDGCHPSFHELSALIAQQVGKSIPNNIPAFMARLMALAGDIIGKKSPINSDKLKKIMSDLTFDDAKARKLLGWQPTPVLKGLKL